MNLWKPIETAPKTGDDILLYEGEVVMGFWCTYIEEWTTGHSDVPHIKNPTLWMPVPKEP